MTVEKFPVCAICLRTKNEVPKLVKVHKLYMCSDCRTDCLPLLDNSAEIGDKTNLTGDKNDTH